MQKEIQSRTFEFAVRIVNLCRRLDEQPGVGRTIGRQLLRSGTSIGANVEEAQAGQSKADFISKISIALKEARETLLLAPPYCRLKSVTR
ncbi:MAG TPA: four helix bundle protein [Pyrinomonadaceae bacterium]